METTMGVNWDDEFERQAQETAKISDKAEAAVRKKMEQEKQREIERGIRDKDGNMIMPEETEPDEEDAEDDSERYE
jgi:hypothetical protein